MKVKTLMFVGSMLIAGNLSAQTAGGGGSNSGWTPISSAGLFSLTVANVTVPKTGSSTFLIDITDFDLYSQGNTQSSRYNTWANVSSAPTSGMMPSGVAIWFDYGISTTINGYHWRYKAVTTNAAAQTFSMTYTATDAEEVTNMKDGDVTATQTVTINP